MCRPVKLMFTCPFKGGARRPTHRYGASTRASGGALRKGGFVMTMPSPSAPCLPAYLSSGEADRDPLTGSGIAVAHASVLSRKYVLFWRVAWVSGQGAATNHSRAMARSGNAGRAAKTPPKVNSLFPRQDTSDQCWECLKRTYSRVAEGDQKFPAMLHWHP